jgi:DNA-binding transcriptional LysR family regulator
VAVLDLQRVATFVAVVEAGSFTAAANTLLQTKATVSFNVRRLEDDLGVALLARSTRHTALTEAGERFLIQAKALLEQAEYLVESTRGLGGQLNGSLRITSTFDFSNFMVLAAIARFSKAHPQLRIDHVASSRPEDLVSERFDVAIRLGSLQDSDHKALMLGRYAVYPVASRPYLASNPIDGLKDLGNALWIGHSRLSRTGQWFVKGANGRSRKFSISYLPRLYSDSANGLLQLALNDAGVALLPAWIAKDHIEAGRLIHLVPEIVFPHQEVHALYRNSTHVPRAVKEFIEYLRSHFIGDRQHSE